MLETPFLDTELGQRARVIYERSIQSKLSPEDTGKYLVIDLDTGEYELDTDDLEAMMRAYHKKPVANRYTIRLGHRTTGYFRGGIVPTQRATGVGSRTK